MWLLHRTARMNSSLKILLVTVTVASLLALVRLATQQYGTPVRAVENEFERTKAEPIYIDNKGACCLKAAKYKIEELCSPNATIMSSSHACNCTVYMLCKLMIVTAVSSNHFKESTDFFASVRAKLPTTKVIVYDLGLTEVEVKKVQSYCNVLEVRRFLFEQYPAHTRDLNKYAWKPLLIDEVSKEYELIYYCDASCRTKLAFTGYLPHLLHLPILPLARLPTQWSIWKYTHDGLLKYLAPKLEKKTMMELLPQGFQATAMILLVNSLMKEKFLAPWVDCALHEECIAPKGSRVYCNLQNPERGCHRFDQSALNVILVRELSPLLPSLQRIVYDMTTLVTIEKHETKMYDTSASRECNIFY